MAFKPAFSRTSATATPKNLTGVRVVQYGGKEGQKTAPTACFRLGSDVVEELKPNDGDRLMVQHDPDAGLVLLSLVQEGGMKLKPAKSGTTHECRAAFSCFTDEIQEWVADNPSSKGDVLPWKITDEGLVVGMEADPSATPEDQPDEAEAGQAESPEGANASA